LVAHNANPLRTYIANQFIEADCVFLLFDIPKSPVATLVVAQGSVIQLAYVVSTTFIVQRDRFV
jgi:hypothetical protein